MCRLQVLENNVFWLKPLISNRFFFHPLKYYSLLGHHNVHTESICSPLVHDPPQGI